MGEKMKEQQMQSGREREQITLDGKNILREQKKLRQLNKQLQDQVTTLQSNPA